MFHALAFQEMKNQYYGVIVCYCSVLLKYTEATPHCLMVHGLKPQIVQCKSSCVLCWILIETWLNFWFLLQTNSSYEVKAILELI